MAHDLDSDVNGKVSYSIAKGDRHKQFSIDEKTGYISVAGNLDREMVSFRTCINIYVTNAVYTFTTVQCRPGSYYRLMKQQTPSPTAS